MQSDILYLSNWNFFIGAGFVYRGNVSWYNLVKESLSKSDIAHR